MSKLRINKGLIAGLLLGASILFNKQDVKANTLEVLTETKDINDYAMAEEDTKVYMTPGGSVVDTLEKGHMDKLLTEVEGYYEVVHEDKIAYIKRDNIKEVDMSNYKKALYINKEKELYSSSNMDNEIAKLGKCEYCQVLEENEDSYYVKADDMLGYITKDNTTDLDGKYIIVDLSDQNIKMFNDKEVLVDSPVVTGKGENSRTHVGAYKINRIRHNTYLIGPNNAWCNYVDYMLNFDEGVGIHDAEYHTHEDGKTHGWRDISEFNKETYKLHGSHGCVNCPNITAEIIYNNAEMHVKVIVKR